ncbi:MAG: toxin-antitoxin system YwqK family antitoxin [Flavobacteriia bacterium]|jgi:hypothetical protein
MRVITSMKSICFIPFFVCFLGYSQETKIESLQLDCGMAYFRKVNSMQNASIIQGPTGGWYIYASAGFGVPLTNLAFCDGVLFSGVAVDRDSAGNVLGLYEFKNGLIEKIKEFTAQGTPIGIMNYDRGQAHGEQKTFEIDGSLRYKVTYEHGIEHGPFYETCYRHDAGLPPCFRSGYTDHKERCYTENSCEEFEKSFE